MLSDAMRTVTFTTLHAFWSKVFLCTGIIIEIFRVENMDSMFIHCLKMKLLKLARMQKNEAKMIWSWLN